MLKAAIQNVSSTEIDDSTKELYDQLKKKTKKLREKGIEGPWRRNIEPGQRSEEVFDKFSCLNLADNDPHQVLDLSKIVACAACDLNYAILIMLLQLYMIFHPRSLQVIYKQFIVEVSLVRARLLGHGDLVCWRCDYSE